MKRVPTLFEMEINGCGVARVLPIARRGYEWVLEGGGEATEMVDGVGCSLEGGVLWRIFDALPGREIPFAAIPIQSEPDPYTGSWPHWVPVSLTDPADKWFVRARDNTPWAEDGYTYEAVGPHFQGNPYGLDDDFLERHGRIRLRDCPRDFEGIMEYLRTHEIEGIVWWFNGRPMCKMRRKDFGFVWPVKEEK